MIIGFAGAFCFRRQPEREVALPALQDESELNQLIAEYRLRPFLPGIDTDEALESQMQLEEYLAMSLNAKKLASLEKKEVPQPIHSMNSPLNDSHKKTGVEHQKRASVQTVPARFQNKSLRGQPQTHIVQPGDTLSGIAQKYLGSASRYLEIYEANKNILSGPDQLKLNMKLVIPVNGMKSNPEPIKQARKPTSPAVSAKQMRNKSKQKKTKATSLADSASSKQQTKKKLFVPMKHSPFSRTAVEKQGKRR